MATYAFRRTLLSLIVLLLLVPAAFAQQTGSISGKVTASDGSALPGVTVEARSNVLPQARVTKLSPRPVNEADLAHLFEDSMQGW